MNGSPKTPNDAGAPQLDPRYPAGVAPAGHEHGVFANRTLNLRSVKAVGYDMDYTLIHYHVDQWERDAFEHARAILADGGLPVQSFAFDPEQFIQGLVIDLALGNLVKATRFGYVIEAAHGTRQLTFEEIRETYSGVVIDLAEPRYKFMNTLFSLSETSLYAQLVDALDAGDLASTVGPVGYDDLYRIVGNAVDETHATNRLKEQIVADPARYVVSDPQTAQTLLDQRLAGKKVLLITNSDWRYTNPMMSFVFDAASPTGRWRDLFDVVVCGAGKPRYFQTTQPVWRLVDEDAGLFEPHVGSLKVGEVYQGGHASLVEESLGIAGDEILYLGDHLFGDVHVSKSVLRWRTALIMRELESEIQAAADFASSAVSLARLMAQKVELEGQLSDLRLQRLKLRSQGLPKSDVDARFQSVRSAITALDSQIAPLAAESSQMGNPTWGPLMRAGSDKSLFARQVERYADIYTSRVSNLASYTPFAYFRAVRTSLPHDR